MKWSGLKAVSDTPNEVTAKSTLMETVGPFCKDCIHCMVSEVARLEDARCDLLVRETIDLVTGSPEKKNIQCWAARAPMNQDCGPRGKLFEQRPTVVIQNGMAQPV